MTLIQLASTEGEIIDKYRFEVKEKPVENLPLYWLNSISNIQNE
jgi:hypothetical protein